MKRVLILLVTWSLFWVARAQDAVPEGEIEPLPPKVMSLRNHAAQIRSWAQVRAFLEKDDSHNHAYQTDLYDCKHFGLELYRRSQASGYQCLLTLIRYYENPVGHCMVTFPTSDRGEFYVDFTPIVSSSEQKPMKSIAFLASGRAQIQIPLNQLPVDFTNNVTGFQAYLDKQDQIEEAHIKLVAKQEEIQRLEQRLAAARSAKKTSAKREAEIERLEAEIATETSRMADASRIYNAYLTQTGSPFDRRQKMTVQNLTQF